MIVLYYSAKAKQYLLLERNEDWCNLLMYTDNSAINNSAWSNTPPSGSYSTPAAFPDDDSLLNYSTKVVGTFDNIEDYKKWYTDTPEFRI